MVQKCSEIKEGLTNCKNIDTINIIVFKIFWSVNVCH